MLLKKIAYFLDNFMGLSYGLWAVILSWPSGMTALLPHSYEYQLLLNAPLRGIKE